MYSKIKNRRYLNTTPTLRRPKPIIHGHVQHCNFLGYHGRVAFFPHLVFAFGGSDISKDDNFEFPFSTSRLPILGVFGTSSIFDSPRLDLLLGFWTSLGNAERLGVRAMAIFLADFLILARTSHDLFFAKYHSTDETTSVRYYTEI